MKRISKQLVQACFCLAFGFISLAVTAQDTNNTEITIVNKQVKDFPERYSLETPMDAFLAVSYISANGKQGLWKPCSTYRYSHLFAGEGTPDEAVADDYKNEILNREIKECIVYRDSVAAVITTWGTDSLYLIRFLSKEDGKWLNAGEDAGEGLVKAKAKAIDRLPLFASYIPMIEKLKQTPADTANFVNYLKTHGETPHRYIIDKLAKHKIVIYGEYHRRKVSWNLLRQVIQEPDFVKTTGTVFFELSSRRQKDLDHFYARKELDAGILLDIFGCEEINGWQDKDEFDFMIALWRLNQKLPENQKIKVILTDYQTPWGDLKTAEDFNSFPIKNRNTSMADVIEQTMKTSTDKRNALFIVGFMHAYKSNKVAGLSSGDSAPTAGAQLVERFSGKDVFSIFPHCLSASNRGEIAGRIRNGLFDYAFKANNNIPVAFDLAGSPFGKEPFDASLEVKFNPNIGSYQENFDGYIFFRKLEDEERGNLLYELFTDEYVEEVKRRAYMSGMKEDQLWYGVPVKDLTKEIIIDSMRKYAGGKIWQINE